MKMPLHHVSFRGRGSLVGSRSVSYFSVAAPSGAEALRLVEAEVQGADGDYAVTRSKRDVEAAAPLIVRRQNIAA